MVVRVAAAAARGGVPCLLIFFDRRGAPVPPARRRGVAWRHVQFPEKRPWHVLNRAAYHGGGMGGARDIVNGICLYMLFWDRHYSLLQTLLLAEKPSWFIAPYICGSSNWFKKNLNMLLCYWAAGHCRYVNLPCSDICLFRRKTSTAFFCGYLLVAAIY